MSYITMLVENYELVHRVKLDGSLVDTLEFIQGNTKYCALKTMQFFSTSGRKMLNKT
ncbi:MAG TPA: hypothetical protein VK050_01915 [Flavobacteriaceae bacterium]|nr:hypothetical protein [Flavobacteriaceae bacterium]